jgi:hypothetical protein
MGTSISRRGFLGRGAALGLAGVGLPALLAACGNDDGAVATTTTAPGAAPPEPASEDEAAEAAQAIVGDVVDFSLTSDGWAGEFGFVTMALHRGVVDGSDVYYVRTDASEEAFAAAEQVVWVPKLAGLAGDRSGIAYVIEGAGEQPTVLSTEPGRDDYTPAFTLHRVAWVTEPRPLTSVAEVTEAEAAGAVEVTDTGIVINAGIVKWSAGEMAVDRSLESYLGEGQLIEPVDTSSLRATFKLGQCYPASRYFVLDHSIAMAAEMTATVFSPGLQDVATDAGATGVTNVFMNGIDGPGPMGFQPSAFDFDAGDPAWSPYWDHFTYAWADGVEPRLLTSQTAIHPARDAGDLEEFPGVPDTEGEVFTVNCPVPVLAPPTYRPPS